MNTPDLINKLVVHLQPIRPTRSIASKLGMLWIWTGLWAIAVLSVLRFRADLPARLSEPFFLIETTALLGFSLLVAIEAFQLSIPGNNGKSVLWVSVVLFVVWVGTFITRYLKASQPSNQPYFDFHFVCSLLILLGSLVPNILLMRSIARDFPLKPGLAGFMAGLSSGALGGFLMQFVCSHDRAPHIFVWHTIPLVLIGAVTAGLTTLWVESRQSKKHDSFSSR